ncbi:hypothetical protein G6F24_017460 [Rhizopus arrhizus]|nr:hypothetical protein G6F24_017460 [Rhizopus arrhizus]
MAFCSEIQHRLRPMLGQQAGDQSLVTDIALHEHVVGIAIQATQGLQIACVRQCVEIDDLDATGDRFENKVTANESGPAGDKPCGHNMFSC